MKLMPEDADKKPLIKLPVTVSAFDFYDVNAISLYDK